MVIQGLEPWTAALLAPCSTDWAIRPLHILLSNLHYSSSIIIHILFTIYSILTNIHKYSYINYIFPIYSIDILSHKVKDYFSFLLLIYYTFTSILNVFKLYIHSLLFFFFYIFLRDSLWPLLSFPNVFFIILLFKFK